MSISTTTATGTLGSAPAAEPRAGLVNKTRNALRAITHSPRMLSGTIILVVFVLVAIFGPQFAHNPNAFVGPALKGPSAKFWLGTTQTGQSVFTQLILSTLSTLEVGFAAGLLATVVALAIGVGDRTVMLQYSTYSVISPEGCASILWKSAEKAKDAAEALGLTAPRLLELGLIDKVVREPLGGAHRNPQSMAVRLKAVLMNQLDELEAMPVKDLLEQRYKRLRSYGAYTE